MENLEKLSDFMYFELTLIHTGYALESIWVLQNLMKFRGIGVRPGGLLVLLGGLQLICLNWRSAATNNGTAPLPSAVLWYRCGISEGHPRQPGMPAMHYTVTSPQIIEVI